MKFIITWLLLMFATVGDIILLQSGISGFIYLGIIMACIILAMWFFFLDRLIS